MNTMTTTTQALSEKMSEALKAEVKKTIEKIMREHDPNFKDVESMTGDDFRTFSDIISYKFSKFVYGVDTTEFSREIRALGEAFSEKALPHVFNRDYLKTGELALEVAVEYSELFKKLLYPQSTRAKIWWFYSGGFATLPMFKACLLMIKIGNALRG